MGGSSPSRANKFLYAPALPPPSVRALKHHSWAVVHKNTYDLYSPVHNVWIRAYSLLGQVGGGWALEFKSFFSVIRDLKNLSNGYARIQKIMHRAV